ncbi:hypothetical protein Mgra_00005260, partial [Meloidogyne graminicola]
SIFESEILPLESQNKFRKLNADGAWNITFIHQFMLIFNLENNNPVLVEPENLPIYPKNISQFYFIKENNKKVSRKRRIVLRTVAAVVVL